MFYYILFFLSLTLGLLLTPLAERLAFRIQFLDIPDGRKRHRVPIPLLGGLAIYVSFFISLTLCILVKPEYFGTHRSMYFGLLIAGSLIFVAGILDDRRGLNAPQKFLVQIIAAILLIYFGYSEDFIWSMLPEIQETPLVRFLGMVFFVFWVVMLTNAINLIDGLDGLAAGISFVSGYFLLLTAITMNRGFLLPFLLPLLGATLGFLRYNFPPARIFLGDAGSMFLGFVLAAISFQGFAKRVTLLTLLIPILLLGIPILDTFTAFARRLLASRNPFVADRDHIHHKMLRLGFTQVQAVSLLYICCTVLGILSLSLIRFGSEIVMAIVIPLSILILAGLWVLGYLRPGVHPELSFREKRAMPRTLKEIVVQFEFRGDRRYAISRDVSKGGIFIRIHDPLKVGSEVLVRYQDPELKEERERQGRVVWTTRGDTPGPHADIRGMGIMFL